MRVFEKQENNFTKTMRKKPGAQKRLGQIRRKKDASNRGIRLLGQTLAMTVSQGFQGFKSTDA
jgi:hypothetical protein